MQPMGEVLPHGNYASAASGLQVYRGTSQKRAFAAERGAKPGSGVKQLAKCEYCGAIFGSSSGLSGHRRRVHLKKPVHTCSICGVGFTMREHFVGHMNMHSGIKAFKCPSCPRAFSYRTSLRSHLRASACGSIQQR